jgi:hypothetical protein
MIHHTSFFYTKTNQVSLSDIHIVQNYYSNETVSTCYRNMKYENIKKLITEF